MIEVFVSSIVEGYRDLRKKIKDELEATKLFKVYLSEYEPAQSKLKSRFNLIPIHLRDINININIWLRVNKKMYLG